jgi:hypothetical protein
MYAPPAGVTSLASLSILLWPYFVSVAAATACFWAAALTRKGGLVHRAAGRAFARLVYTAAVAGAGVVLSGAAGPALAGPAAWVALGGLLIVVTAVQHGVAVIDAGAVPAAVRSRTHASLNALLMVGAVLLLAAAVVWQYWLAAVLVPAGFVIGLRNLSYAGRRSATPRDWEVEHLTSLITGSVALHTALVVELTPQMLAWTVPATTGVIAIGWLRARHRRA